MQSTSIAPTLTTRRPLDPDALGVLLGQMVNDMGAAVTGALVLLGDRLGIYAALAEAGPVTCAQLAEHTGLNERYLLEWLSAQAASHYITYDAATETFGMTPEQIAVFADPHSPANMTGGFYSLSAVYHDEPRVAEGFRNGRGVNWGEHHSCLFCGVERFFRPGYEANIQQHWIPALDGIEPRLLAGGRVADLGCGHGASTLIMARAYPNSTFYGFDNHGPSIEAARRHAEEQGLRNVHFAVATAQDFPGQDYDLITTFDALHDMGDPVGAAAHARQAVAPGGAWMIVEPMAGDSLAENLNPVGRVFYGFSTLVCTPAAMSQPGGLALGAQAGEKRLAGIIREGGFSQVRRAAETPFNLILEARP